MPSDPPLANLVAARMPNSGMPKAAEQSTSKEESPSRGGGHLRRNFLGNQAFGIDAHRMSFGKGDLRSKKAENIEQGSGILNAWQMLNQVGSRKGDCRWQHLLRSVFRPLYCYCSL